MSPTHTHIVYHTTEEIYDCIKACNFTVILAPGCTHADRISPITQRKINLCYRTYRLNASCVYEMFCGFLTTKGGQRAKPILLIRSGLGTPTWISALVSQTLKVGMSHFQCCVTNHTSTHTCQKKEAMLPYDATIIFVSHERLGWRHPDPSSVQIKTFLKVMRRLRSGEISQVEMNVFHTLLYKTNHIVRSSEWYICIDSRMR